MKMQAAHARAGHTTGALRRPGVEATLVKGWWRARRWMLARRAVQAMILALFLVGPWFGWWIVKGNLASSLTLGVLPLTDPFVLLQSVAAGLTSGHWPLATAWVGAAIVLGVYLVVGGRSYCAWVCPVNPVTDLAAWLRMRLGIRGGAHVSRRTRIWLLGAVVLVAGATGTMAWEMVNPVTGWQRGLVFGLGAGWAVMAAVFAFDLLVMRRGWCGHLCPMGAFYAQVGRVAAVRVVAHRRDRCDDCLECYAVCPEPVVIKPALKGVAGTGAAIVSGDCTNCGRCVDVCAQDVFSFGTRWSGRDAPAAPTGLTPARVGGDGRYSHPA